MGGTYMRKCKAEGEIALVGVAELGGGSGARTRARARQEVAMAVAKKITKVQRSNGEVNYASKCIDLKSRRRAMMITSKKKSNSSSGASGSSSCVVEEANCTSGSISEEDHMPASCCSSSNASSSQLVKDSFAILDPEDEEIKADKLVRLMYSERRERTETTPSMLFRVAELSDDLDSLSTLSHSEAKFRLRSTVQKMPSDSEIEELFSAAEKDLQKRFIEKYNFDIVKDVPLEGRYEWVPVKP